MWPERAGFAELQMRSCWCERTAQWFPYREDVPMECLSVTTIIFILLICAYLQHAMVGYLFSA